MLLDIPALIQGGVPDVAQRVYGSIGPAFHGLRTSIVALLLMALIRIKRPEGQVALTSGAPPSGLDCGTAMARASTSERRSLGAPA